MRSTKAEGPTATPADPRPSPGLRERKAAATRIAVARALEVRLAHASLAEITADQLAADAGVSRVTFFNYFPTKEHALDLLHFVWLHEGVAAIAKRGLGGRAALEFLFDEVGRRLQENPERMRRALASTVATTSPREPPRFGPAECALVASDAPPVPVASFGMLIMRLVDEARARGEIDAQSSSYDLAHLLGAVYFGGAFVGRSASSQDWRRLYRHHVARALGPVPTRAQGKGKHHEGGKR